MSADAAAEEQFGPYLVYERLGVGGMATVHRALERGGSEDFERTVALKRLLPHLAEDASFIKAFVREAKLASFLHHVNIVQIYELGRVGTEYFISMEYIDGRDIRRILRHARKVTGPPPLHVTVGLLQQLCDALDYAHNKIDDDGHPLGLVHRDVSPSNLLVTSQGHLKVIDFGIAKAQSSQLRTQTGRVKGKLAYMAPEAISGRELDARSDLFAAGVIAHELLTARPLFASKNEYQTLLKVQRGDILPPSTFNEASTPEMDAIVMKALAREPDDRYASAAAMREDLGRLRRALGLATSTRDVATWIDWAFSLEPPVGFAGQTGMDQTGSAGIAARHTPTPARRAITPISVKQRAATPRPEDDEAVEIAWGSGADDADAGPIVLDDIPDVSSKHLASPYGAIGGGDHDDDIPAAMPSHGERDSQPELLLQRPTPAPRTRPQRGTDDPAATGRLGARTPSQPPGPSPITRPSQPPAPAREPSAEDTIPGGQRARQLPTERMASLAGPVLPDELERASAPMLDSLDIPPLVRRPSEPPANLRRPSDPMQAVVRRPSEPPPRASVPVGLDADRSRIPRTKPGHQPARRAAAPARAFSELADASAAAPMTMPAHVTTIGASMIERQGRRRWWIPVLVVALLAGGGAAAFVIYKSRDGAPAKAEPRPSTPPPPVGVAPSPTPEPGTIKFVTEPADAVVRIDGHDVHTGSPWSTELPPGAYPIEIQHAGFKSWLTTVELSAREVQTMRVVLEPLGAPKATAVSADATLIVTTTPAGLQVVLDGAVLAQASPIKMPIRPGTHTVIVRKDGADVWRQDVTAQSDATYEYTPAFTADKERERQELNTRPRVPAPVHHDVTLPDATPHVEEPSNEPAHPPVGSAAPVHADPPPIVVAPPPVVVPPPPVHAGPPPLIAPNAVSRVSGDAPSFTAFRSTEMPAIVSAKLCIDTSGHVTSADVMTKIEHRAASDIASALRGWSFTPYKTPAGVASPACFVLAMRTR